MNDVGIMHDLRTIYFTTYYYLDFFVRTALCVFIVLRKGGGVVEGGASLTLIIQANCSLDFLINTFNK